MVQSKIITQAHTEREHVITCRKIPVAGAENTGKGNRSMHKMDFVKGSITRLVVFSFRKQ